MPKLKMTADDVSALADKVFPQVKDDFRIARIAEGVAVVEMDVAERHLRPGGTVSGPSMFALADCAFYYVVLAHIGPRPLAVTTNLTIDFMRKPDCAVMVAEARLLKLGRSLAVGDVMIRAKGQDAVLARAGVTYAIPPEHVDMSGVK